MAVDVQKGGVFVSDAVIFYFVIPFMFLIFLLLFEALRFSLRSKEEKSIDFSLTSTDIGLLLSLISSYLKSIEDGSGSSLLSPYYCIFVKLKGQKYDLDGSWDSEPSEPLPQASERNSGYRGDNP